jgi:hypothetical protein
MPRHAPTRSGAPAQPAAALGPAQAYGAGQDTQQAVNAVPLADNRTKTDRNLQAGIDAARTRAAALTQPPAAGGGGNPVEDPALAAAHAMPAVAGSLSAPTAYPDRPVTHGLSLGPGGGPDVLMGAGDVAAGGPIWRELAAASGDPYFVELARRAGLG